MNIKGRDLQGGCGRNTWRQQRAMPGMQGILGCRKGQSRSGCWLLFSGWIGLKEESRKPGTGRGHWLQERGVGWCSQIGLDCLFSYIRDWLAGYSIHEAQRSPFWNLLPPYRRCQVCWGLGFAVQGLCDVLGLLIPSCRRCPLRFSLFVSLFVTFCLADLLSYLACVCVCVYTHNTHTQCAYAYT